jgi:imidazolonepropionase
MLLTDLTLADCGPGGLTCTPDAAIAIAGERILWAGPRAALPADLAVGPTHALGGRLVTAALIDCHTHVVFGGDRAREFDMRLNGATYEEIARAGGGILSSVRATRAASEEALLAQALRRVDPLLAEGVATLEIKSGYGLDVESELKMLRVARRIGRERKATVVTSWLAAHALPPEFRGCRSIISNICRRRTSPRSPPREPSRRCCPAPSTPCARPRRRRSPPCARRACRWRFRAIATPAPRR